MAENLTYSENTDPTENVINARVVNVVKPSYEWDICTVILKEGEIGLDSDNHILKVGDGVHIWNDLSIFIQNGGGGTGGGVSEARVNEIIDGKGFALDSRVTQVQNSIPTKTSQLTNDSGFYKMWFGTQSQYDALTTKDANTLYNIYE